MAEKHQKTNPLLTIAIPHLNDPGGLEHTLAAVCPYTSEDIEIIVCENRSDEIFEAKLKQIRLKFDKPKFLRSSVKLDYDANIDRCVLNSRGDYVWLIGCGDFPIGESIVNIARILKENSEVSNFLVLVKTSLENMRIDNALSIKRKPIQKRKTVTLDQTFNPALSGNIFKREAWLDQIKKGLVFTNWGHVERSLQIQSQEQTKFVEISSQEGAIHVDQPEEGWWMQDDHTFLLNTLLFRSVLSYYHANTNLKRYDLPFTPNRVSTSVLKAILYSRTIETPATKETVEQVLDCLAPDQLSYAFYKLVNGMPKTLVRLLRRMLKAIYRLAPIN